jgi:regulation of enolase protein 1 (concanavalin A-like superfamily)
VTVTTPSADTTSASTPFTFSGSATDSGGLQSVSCKNTTTNYTVTVNLSGTSANWNATVPLTSGANVIQVTATNTANVVSSIVTRTVTYTPPSSGWTGTAVGTATGSFQQTSSDSFSVSGTGTVFEGTQNQHYYVYQNATGDCSITARITSMGTADGNAKVGVMIRENASAESSAYVFCGLTPNYGAIAFGHGNAATYNVGGSTVTAAPPYWVRVSRSGSTITTSISSDGVTWNALGGTYAAPWVSMGNPVTVGLAVHSHNGATNTATFTNVSTTGTPSPWTGSTIGTATGSFQQTGAAAFTVAGSGTNMSGNDVQHYYVSMPATDDCSISARVTLPAGLNSAAKAGVMIRESNDPSAAYVFCALTPAYGSVAFGHGTGTGYNVGGSTLAVATTYWVKVSRTGGTITTSLSSDGVTWNALGGTYAAPWVSMGSSVTVGLAVHGAGSSASITFDNVVMAP